MPIYSGDLNIVRDADGAISVDGLTLPRIWDYWDKRGDNIRRFSEQLGSLPEEQLPAIFDALQAAVLRHLTMW